MKNIKYYRELTSYNNSVKGIVILCKRIIRKMCRFLIEPIVDDINIENEKIWADITILKNNLNTNISTENLNNNNESIENMPYFSLLVDNIIYFYNSHDMTIPNFMKNYHMNWAKQDIETFILICDKYFYNQNIENGLFLDIGGNIGTTCIYVRKHLKPNFKFIAFEPIEDNYKLLSINTMINGFHNDIIVEYLGLSNEEKLSKVNINDTNRGGVDYLMRKFYQIVILL